MPGIDFLHFANRHSHPLALAQIGGAARRAPPGNDIMMPRGPGWFTVASKQS